MTTARQSAAEVLFDVATALELADENPARVRVYRQAARNLMRDGITPDLDLPGLGPRLRQQLTDILVKSAVDEHVAT